MTEIFCLMYKIQDTKIHGNPRFPAGSFAVLVADQLWYSLGIISNVVGFQITLSYSRSILEMKHVTRTNSRFLKFEARNVLNHIGNRCKPIIKDIH